MKKLQYGIFIGIFVLLSGLAMCAYASEIDTSNHNGSGDSQVTTPTLDIRPHTINLKRDRDLIKAILTLPESTDVSLIDTKSILLSITDVVPLSGHGHADTDAVNNAISDFDSPQDVAPFVTDTTTTLEPIHVSVNESTNSIIAKFSTHDVEDLIDQFTTPPSAEIEADNIEADTEFPALVTFVIQWELTSDSIIYTASDKAGVINHGKRHINGKDKDCEGKNK